MQSAVLVAMNACINELKKACTTLDAADLTLENGLFRNFDTKIRLQLDAEWHKLSLRTKQLVNDLKPLRQLLDYLLRFDAVQFYQFLLTLKTTSTHQTSPSLWLTTEGDCLPSSGSFIYTLYTLSTRPVSTPSQHTISSYQYTPY